MRAESSSPRSRALTAPSAVLCFADLAKALEDQARGLLCAEAAVKLLIGHRSWLVRTDFVGSFDEMLETMSDEAPMALLDWPSALDALRSGWLHCSSSEGQVLALAASIAEGIPVDLRDALGGLDETNACLVAASVLHAAGHGRSSVPVSLAGQRFGREEVCRD
jgi:hypothetical protein